MEAARVSLMLPVFCREMNGSNPYYDYNTSDPRDVQRTNNAWIEHQMLNDPAYSPRLWNGVNHPVPPSPQQELRALVAEAGLLEALAHMLPRLKSNYFSSPQFTKESKPYHDALECMKTMFLGKAPLIGG